MCLSFELQIITGFQVSTDSRGFARVPAAARHAAVLLLRRTNHELLQLRSLCLCLCFLMLLPLLLLLLRFPAAVVHAVFRY